MLCSEGFVVVQRDRHHAAIPVTHGLENDQRDELFVRQGQLGYDNRLHGIGKKITLRPTYLKKTNNIKGYDADCSFYDEGHFNYD